MNESSASQKIAYICNANCEKRYDSQTDDADKVRQTLTDKGYDVRTRGCLSVCNVVGDVGVELKKRAIVNVELIDQNTVKQFVAGYKDDGSVGMIPPRVPTSN